MLAGGCGRHHGEASYREVVGLGIQSCLCSASAVLGGGESIFQDTERGDRQHAYCRLRHKRPAPPRRPPILLVASLPVPARDSMTYHSSPVLVL